MDDLDEATLLSRKSLALVTTGEGEPDLLLNSLRISSVKRDKEKKFVRTKVQKRGN